jgi:hypothetical protein
MIIFRKRLRNRSGASSFSGSDLRRCGEDHSVYVPGTGPCGCLRWRPAAYAVTGQVGRPPRSAGVSLGVEGAPRGIRTPDRRLEERCSRIRASLLGLDSAALSASSTNHVPPYVGS